MKFESFTLLEMLVTLSIFSICMLALYGVMETNLRLINQLFSNGSGGTQAVMLEKNIESIVRNSFEIKEEEKGLIRMHSFNNADYFVHFTENSCVVSEKRKNILWNEKTYYFSDTDIPRIEILRKGEISALRLIIKAKNFSIDRTILAGSAKY